MPWRHWDLNRSKFPGIPSKVTRVQFNFIWFILFKLFLVCLKKPNSIYDKILYSYYCIFSNFINSSFITNRKKSFNIVKFSLFFFLQQFFFINIKQRKKIGIIMNNKIRYEIKSFFICDVECPGIEEILLVTLKSLKFYLKFRFKNIILLQLFAEMEKNTDKKTHFWRALSAIAFNFFSWAFWEEDLMGVLETVLDSKIENKG